MKGFKKFLAGAAFVAGAAAIGVVLYNKFKSTVETDDFDDFDDDDFDDDFDDIDIENRGYTSLNLDPEEAEIEVEDSEDEEVVVDIVDEDKDTEKK